MIRVKKDRLNEIIENFNGKKIIVFGDLMLDNYLWGTVVRISPEAPVPVVEINSISSRLGGAANVGNNIFSLGGMPVMVGVVGNDQAGESIKSKIKEDGLTIDGIFVDETRPTTLKTRIIAHNQHVVRTDLESKRAISPFLQKKILSYIKSIIDDVDAIILEDYNKGVIVPNLIKEVVELASSRSKIITVDPKFNNFFEFTDVTMLKPNVRETEDVMGVKLVSEEDVKRIGIEMLNRLQCKCLLLTRGEKGMTLFLNNSDITNIPTKARKVHDVSGAGDTVISTFTMALTGGASFLESAVLANYAAGKVCEEVGIVPIEVEKLREFVNNN
ncbi:MAG: D-glycero-beta-D-manno-heptose-7-phosphate kinase, partial [Fidelibacterota bacterium]